MAEKVLIEEDVLDILRRLEAGEPGARIARYYGVSQQSVSAIKCGATWAHVTGITRR